MKNINWIWVIAVILALIFIVPNLQKKTSSYYNIDSAPTLKLCQSISNQNNFAKCNGQCKQITSQIKSCVDSFNILNPLIINEYIMFADFQTGCNLLGGISKQLFDCIYSGSIPTCNTIADTNCNGCVSDLEWPSAVSKWETQTGISDSEWPIVVSKWEFQEGC